MSLAKKKRMCFFFPFYIKKKHRPKFKKKRHSTETSHLRNMGKEENVMVDNKNC